jgi:formylglycine-generating enzyme required for sulfatase activity
MGSNDFYPEEQPVHEVNVEGLWMDEHAVTAAEFRRFVRDTRYVTVAERSLDPADYPDADPELLVPGGTRLSQVSRPRRPERRPGQRPDHQDVELDHENRLERAVREEEEEVVDRAQHREEDRGHGRPKLL